MYYQLTMQFSLEEIDKAKKILDLAKELDVKRMDSLGPLPEPETFAWEENKKLHLKMVRQLRMKFQWPKIGYLKKNLFMRLQRLKQKSLRQ